MKWTRLSFATGLALVVSLLTFGCDDSSNPAQPPPTETEPELNVVTVTAEHQELELSRTTINSGWVTFEFDNVSHAPHFMTVERMPVFEGEQKTVEDSRAEVVPVFQNFMDDFRGEPPSFPEAGFELPAWYGEVVFVGGPGLTSAGEINRTTMSLEPGTYVVECYVKTAEGVFHVTNGMIGELIVTDEPGGAEPPSEISARVTISSASGIVVDGTIGEAGEHTFEVISTDQMAYSHFLGHDAHLVRLDGADLGALATWMNWLVPGSLADPAPAGVTFLGGTQDMPGGSRAFVTVDLPSGDYAWIAEVPDPMGKNMFVQFTVP